MLHLHARAAARRVAGYKRGLARLAGLAERTRGVDMGTGETMREDAGDVGMADEGRRLVVRLEELVRMGVEEAEKELQEEEQKKKEKGNQKQEEEEGKGDEDRGGH